MGLLYLFVMSCFVLWLPTLLATLAILAYWLYLKAKDDDNNEITLYRNVFLSLLGILVFFTIILAYFLTRKESSISFQEAVQNYNTEKMMASSLTT